MKTPYFRTVLRHGLHLLLLLAGILCVMPGHAQTPQNMTYQGFLTDQNGAPLGTNGPQNYDIVFRIWTQPTGGSAPLYGELQTVTVANGYFSVLLGQGTPYVNGGVTDPQPPLSSVFTTNNSPTTSSRYVEMTVKGLNNGSDVTILPRLQLVSAPYAFVAANANALVSPTTGNTLVSSAGTNVAISGSLSAASLSAGSLSVNGSITDLGGNIYMDNAEGIFAKNAAGAYEVSFLPRWSDNVTYLNSGSGGFNLRNDNSTSMMFVNPSGNVGIGTTTPGFPLSFPNSTGDKISLWGTSGNSIGFGVGPALLQIHTDVVGTDIAFGSGNSASMNEVMRIKGTGNVGIGTNAPQAPLHVFSGQNVPAIFDSSSTAGTWNVLRNTSSGGSTWITFSSGSGNGEGAGKLIFARGNSPTQTANDVMTLTPAGFVGIGTTSPSRGALEIDNEAIASLSFGSIGVLTPNGASAVGSDSFGGYESIYASDLVFAADFVAFSDERIKNVKGQSDSAADLKTLMGIKITDFTYRDPVSKGSGPQKKVIAQQVERVYPQAVSRSCNVVPDIYTNAAIQNGWIQLATDLKVGDRVKLISPGRTGVYDVQEVRPGAFRTDFGSNATTRVFVYGREVKDFRSVDYEAISMLNVSATQELAKQLDQKAKEVKTLEQEVAELKQAVAQLAAESKRTKVASETATPGTPVESGKAAPKPLTTASLDQ